MSIESRINSLLPLVNGRRSPKNLRIYDNGGRSLDRYTAVFTGNYRGRNGWCSFLSFSKPSECWIFNQHMRIIDKPSYSHLGKKIGFFDLPEDCRKGLLEDYCGVWDIEYKDLDLYINIFDTPEWKAIEKIA